MAYFQIRFTHAFPETRTERSITCFLFQPSRKCEHLATVASLCAKAGNAVECVGTLKCTSQQAKQGHCMQLGDDFTRCEAAMTSGKCQAGLTRAHINAWRRIVHSGEAAAWVFE